MSDELLFDFNDEITNRPKRRKVSKGRPNTSNVAVIEEADGWRLYTVGDCGVLPAGSRLLRAKPWPVDRFIFDTEEEAREAAEKLAAYLGTDVTPHQFSSIDLHDPA
jgi:hypothetical protein